MLLLLLLLVLLGSEAEGEEGQCGAGGGGTVRFWRVDVTREEDLDALVEGRFDVVLMNMAIMDVAPLEPLARALPRLLADGGV